ncbi:DUF6087 family protein [Streptomyces sp. NPDC004050]
MGRSPLRPATHARRTQGRYARPQSPAAAHLDPDAPRLILEWDGFQWVPVTVADDYPATGRILSPVPEPQQRKQSVPRQPGRHRKPQ